VSDDAPLNQKRCPKCQRSYSANERICPADGEPLSFPDPYHLVNRVLADRYRLDALVGIGGMGAVYSAWHLAIGRRVAVKILQPNIAMLDERMVTLFEREARMAGGLVHENIANVLDAGRTTDGIAYIAMEWLDGGSLDDELVTVTSLGLERTADVLQQLAAALDAAHAAQIIHRDLKPANVMVTKDAAGRMRLKIVDFGIAKAVTEVTQTARSIVTGTPSYASPEHLAGGIVDARSDIYSLGVMLFRMLTGALPFDATSIEDMVRLKRGGVRVRVRQFRPEVPLVIDQLVDRMLARDPNDRPATAGDVSRIFSAAVAIPAAYGQADPPLRADLAADTAAIARQAFAPAARESPALDVTVPDIFDANPLLSEFNGLPRLQRWLHRHRGGGRLALIVALAGLSAILLSHIVGAACIRVALQGPSGLQRTLLFGYVAEPNAALWYLAGAPLFVVVASHFLNLAHGTLRELEGGERLVARREAGAPPISPLSAIARMNRRWFRIIVPAICVLSFSAVYIPEFVAKPAPAFGWVGALSVRDFEGVSLRDLQAQKRVGAIPIAATLCDAEAADCDVRVAGVEGGHGLADRDRWSYPFVAFIVVALGLQVAFGIYGGWIVAKILFLFGMFARALVNRSGRGLTIDLDFADSEMRFGLGALDVVHNMVLLLTLIGSIVFLLQRVANVAKGSSFFAGMVGLQLFSQFGVFVVSALPVLLVLFAPMAVFMVLLETEIGRAIEGIERERAALRKSMGGVTPPQQRAAIERAEEQLRRRRDLVRRQRPWPRKNATYRTLLVTTVFALGFVPFAIESAAASGVAGVSQVLSRFSEMLCWLL
jgi:serine/threonine protein kinase